MLRPVPRFALRGVPAKPSMSVLGIGIRGQNNQGLLSLHSQLEAFPRPNLGVTIQDVDATPRLL